MAQEFVRMRTNAMVVETSRSPAPLEKFLKNIVLRRLKESVVGLRSGK